MQSSHTIFNSFLLNIHCIKVKPLSLLSLCMYVMVLLKTETPFEAYMPLLQNTYYSRDLIFTKQSPMIYSRDFSFAICHLFFYNTYVRNYWRGLYFRVYLLSRIYAKIKSSRIKSLLQYMFSLLKFVLSNQKVGVI